MRNFILLGIVLLSVASAQGAELFDRFTSVRALGMGNAFTPIATGTDSLFYNPSGLAATDSIALTLLKLKIGANGTDAYENASDFDGDYAETLRDFYGEKIWVGASGVSGFTMPYFGIVAYDSLNVSADLSNPALPDFNVNYVNDYGIATGVGFEIIPKIWRMGFSAKRIARIGSSATIPVSSLATLDDEDLMAELDNRGIGYSLDLGMAITFPSIVKPTLSFVWRDIGNTSFSLDEGSRNPPTDYNEMIGAFSLQIDSPVITITPVLEMRYMNTQPTDIDLGKKLHGGLELDLPGITLRGGYNQGYYTAGLGMDFGVMALDVATYGVELGEYPGQQEDRRYVLELTFGFGFDVGKGTFLGVTKENRRKLKQRR